MFELTEKLEALIFRLAFVSGKSPNACLCEILNEYFDLNDKKKLQVKKFVGGNKNIQKYKLVKENICEYNIRETLSIAHRIENINYDIFRYPEQKAELEILLQKEN